MLFIPNFFPTHYSLFLSPPPYPPPSTITITTITSSSSSSLPHPPPLVRGTTTCIFWRPSRLHFLPFSKATKVDQLHILCLFSFIYPRLSVFVQHRPLASLSQLFKLFKSLSIVDAFIVFDLLVHYSSLYQQYLILISIHQIQGSGTRLEFLRLPLRYQDSTASNRIICSFLNTKVPSVRIIFTIPQFNWPLPSNVFCLEIQDFHI